MKEVLERVVEENMQLQEKLSKLCVFIDESEAYLKLSHAMRILLERQRDAMKEYRDILDVRIELMTLQLKDN